jgi:type VI secretion system secreted protein VgrG
MDFSAAIADTGQSRYSLHINNSPVKPDVLRFRGREALSEPFKWDIEFTTPQANIAPEQVLMKYASFRMRSGKNVHGIITRLEWLSTSADQSHYTITLSSRLARTYPPREVITQWRETDLEFIQRILSEVGIYWRTEMDNTRELDVFIFADSQLNYQFDVRLPHSEPSGLYDGAEESVWGVRTWHNVVTGTVATRDYNYRTATTLLDATAPGPR